VTYTGEEERVPGAGSSVAAPGPGREGNGDGRGIEYPSQRGREAWERLANWVAGRFTPLGQPEHLVTFVVVLASVVFVFWQFDPSKLFSGTTISGGDTGAHVLLPWVVAHQVLPNLRLTGWTSSNWDGFPAVTFYFPLPVYSAVLLSQVISYGVAFKLITAAPMIFMPLSAWAMGRFARAPFPVPAVLAAATLPFMFGTEFSIYGGNIPSTLAGEFAFAWSLNFAFIFLGLMIGGLQSGRYRAWAAVAFCCAFMSHIDPTLFAGGGAVVIFVLYVLRTYDWRGALRWVFPVFAVGGLLAGWWAWPFHERFPYLTNMGYQKITTYITTLFPTGDTWLFILAGVGAALSLSRRLRIGEFFFIVAALSAFAFRFMPQSILWNARVLPFWFLSLYLLGALAVAQLYMLVAERFTRFAVTLRAAALPGPLVVLVAALIWVGFPLHILPGEHTGTSGAYTWLGVTDKTNSYIPDWVSWNYSGYQAGCGTSGVEVPSAKATCAKTRWPEYTQVVAELEKLSKAYGCGNVMWEYQSQMNNYGTPDALTILPYWTNGCIGSMEGLYYEASATTPFHFIDQSELSLQPSDPMNFPPGVTDPYSSAPNVALGVQHLQMLGVKYYMALNAQLQAQAAADPSLKLVSTLGPYYINYSGNTGVGVPTGNAVKQYWKIYLVEGSPRVHPLANQPVVMKGMNNVAQPKWLKPTVTWYLDPSDWDVYLAATGPKSWARVPYNDLALPVKPEPPTTVSNIDEHNASISFDVSKVGVPVVVTISYFPNWQVSGAKGIYRVSPNLMVVVPTSHHVRMWYGQTPVNYEGWILTLIALAGLVFLIRRPQAQLASVRRPGLGEKAPGRGGRASGPGLLEAALQKRLGRSLAPEEPSPTHGAHAAPTGVPATGVPATGVPATGVPATGVPATGVPATGVPATGVPAIGGTSPATSGPGSQETDGQETDGQGTDGQAPDGQGLGGQG
jgi:hypothetical protein